MTLISGGFEAWLWNGIFYVRPSHDIHNVIACFRQQADHAEDWNIFNHIIAHR